MGKAYKTGFSAFLNTRLKPVDYHGTLTHPIYVRVVFKRYNTVFKSYYFDLFSKKKYQINFAGLVKFPTVAEIIAFEENIITLINDNLSEDFTLARFKAGYEYYTRDICDQTEELFNEYLFTFFSDEGLPDFASILRSGISSVTSSKFIRDLELALSPDLYTKLIKNALYYAPPYLALYGFIVNIKKYPAVFTAVDWETVAIKEKFYRYLKLEYSGHENDIMEQVEQLFISNRTLADLNLLPENEA